MGTKTIRAAIAALCVATAFSPVYAEAKQATLKATGYSGSAITDFQALVKLSASNDAYGFSYNEAGGSTATNIWFTDAGGTPIPHDIDTWNTSGDSFVWVKIPTLTTGTEIVMHWSDDASDVQTASGNVWTDFVGVWHMNETGTTAEPDSTGHGLNAAPINNSSASTSINTDTNGGQVGNGRAVTQATMLKVTGHNSNNRLSNAQQFTISGWVKKTTDGGEYPRVFVGNVDGNRTQWEVYGWTDSKKDTKTYVRGSGNTDWATTGIILNSASGWHYLTVVYNGTTATIYDKGVSKNSAAINAAAQGGFFTIGGWTGKNNRSFVGTFDEVRMYNGTLSADRIAADYATMNDPTTFLTLVSDNTPVTAAWTGGGNDGDVSNADNWACTNSANTEVSGLPTAATDVTVSGDNLYIQIPSGSSFQCKSFTLGNCSLSADCDLCGVGTVTIPSGVTVDLKDRALFVQSLAGDGVITNTANGTYTTLDFISTGAGQYIITGYTPAGDDVVSTHVNFNNADCQSIWCSRGANGTANTFTCITYAAPPFFRFDRNTTAPTGTRTLDVATNVHYEIIANYGTGACKVNGTNVYTMDTASYTPGSALSLFRLMNNANGTALTSYGTTDYKMYHFRICGADGSPKLDLVPAKNGSNVAGLWDRVSGTFYPSASSDAFNAGTEKGRGELVFHVPSGATATRSGVTIAASVIVSKEGEGALGENALSYSKTKASPYNQREGTVRFAPSTDNYLDLGPTNFCISGGTLASSGSHLHIGRERTGQFIQNGGTVDMSSYHVYVGIRASGEYDLTGGELNGVNLCYIGFGDNAVGTMRVSGGKVNAADLRIGANGTGHGDVLQNGGEVTTTTLSLPAASTATGAYDFSGGTLTINANALVGGNNGSGSFFQSGGSCTVKGYPWIGADANSVGLYEMTGGTLTASSQPLSVGRYGTGTLNVSGSAVVTASHGVRVGFTNGTAGSGSGTLVVTNGGTIATSSIYGGGDTVAQASVLFSNATVKVTAAGEILKDLHDVTISAGGLTITNDFAVSITNTTLKVTPGTTAITMTGTGTLDLSNAMVQFASTPSRAFYFAVAQGGTLTGLPTVTRPWKARLTDGGTRCKISKGGLVILVR